MKFRYCMPASAPLYPQPPYHFKDNNSISIVFKTNPEVLKELLPPRLLPNPDSFAFFYVGELKVVSPVKGTYKEAGIGIPVLFDGMPGNYYVYLYLDTAMAIIPGREIWGWPKKDAEIDYHADQDVFSASVKREGVEIIRATVKASEQVNPIPDQTDVPAFNLKIIPSVRKNHLPDVYQLTSTETTSMKKEVWRGQATLSFMSSPNDPFASIPILEIISGEQIIDDLSLGYGDVLLDYLAEDQR